jgi:hypothetical protein
MGSSIAPLQNDSQHQGNKIRRGREKSNVVVGNLTGCRKTSQVFVGRGFTHCGKIQNAVIPRHAACRGIPLFLCFKPREIPHFVRFTVNAHRERNDNESRFFLKLLQSHLIRPQS